MVSTTVERLAPGVWGILATPFRGPQLEVDTESLHTLVDHYRRVGAQGVVALGVLGEAARLDSREREQVMRTVVRAAGNLPVVAGMSATATAPAVEEARRAAAAGVRTVMVLVSSGDPTTLVNHLDRIASVSGCTIVLQDHPATTGIVVSPATLAEVVQRTPAVVAIKAEAPPTAPTIAALKKTIDVPVFGGLGGVGLLDELLAGSAGAMTGFAFPEALVATVTAWEQGGYAPARDAFVPWMPLVLFEAQEKVSLALRKEILRRRGLIAESAVRPPGLLMPPSLIPALEAHMSAVERLETSAAALASQ